MKLTLQIVRNVLGANLGNDSFIMTFIKEVKEGEVGSACIDEQGTLIYDPRFLKQYAVGEPELFALIMHELMHPLFAHYRYGSGELENIACDAIINAGITAIFPEQSNDGALFKNIYNSSGLEMILRPDCDNVSNRYTDLYKNLYHPEENTELTTGNVLLALKVLLPSKKQKVENILLLGNHEDGEGSTTLSPETIEQIGHELEKHISSSERSGKSSILKDLIVDVIHSRYTLKRELLQHFTTRQKINSFTVRSGSFTRRVSPIPIQLSKGDMVKVAAGCYPLYYHNQIIDPKTKTQGLALYLDVSGSVNEYLPTIISILRRFSHEIREVYQFSNKVVKTNLNQLCKGHITTTMGTDFDCVARSILEHNYEKAIVITDGYAKLNSDHREKLLQSNVRILSILFGEVPLTYPLRKFGPSVSLKDMKTIL